MVEKKFVLVGAGSQSFGMKTMTNIIWELETFDGSTICLHDIDEIELKRTKMLADIAVKQLEEIAKDPEEDELPKGTLKVEATLNRKEAFENADFIISSIEINRYPLWKMDYYIPIERGSKQIYGENGGPGGTFHSLRVIPPVVEICKDVEDICPNAFFFNYTNPMSRVCLAIHRATPKVKFAGLCHEFIGMKHRIENMFRDILPKDYKSKNFEEYFRMTTAGLNHFAFLQELVDLKRNKNLLPEIGPRLKKHYAEKNPLMWYLFEKFGQVPYTEDSHSGEYIGWARGISNVYGYPWDEHMKADEKRRKETLESLEKGTEFFWWLTRPEERVVEIIKGIVLDLGYRELAVNIPNKGYIPCLWNDVVVEVPAKIDKNGFHGETINTFPKGIQGLLRQEAIQHDLCVEAALTGAKDVLLQCLLLDSTIHEARDAEKIMNAMLEKQKKYLPQFFKNE
ncbi:MAG: family 4 glycosyl hydrolase [Candidatus Helarchaeota archaeon]